MWQWKNFLIQLEAGATDDKVAYMKLVAQLTPMPMPPINGINTRKKQVTTDIRYATQLSATDTTVLMGTAHLTARCALAVDGVVATNYYNMLTASCSNQLSAACRYQTLLWAALGLT